MEAGSWYVQHDGGGRPVSRTIYFLPRVRLERGRGWSGDLVIELAGRRRRRTVRRPGVVHPSLECLFRAASAQCLLPGTIEENDGRPL